MMLELCVISEHIIRFFSEVWQTPNNDVQVPELVAGCRALGSTNKIITGPLWRVLESPDVTILEMNTYFSTLVT